MRSRHRALVAALALAAAAPSASFTARVTSVRDGDTLVVAQGTHDVRVRLFGIDCPEGDQPYGDRARVELSGLVARQEVRVEPVDRDAHARTVARVFVGARDVSAELVRAGAAWVYRRYTDDPALVALESEARAAHRGLWALPESQRRPPWEWRHRAVCGTKHACVEMKNCAEARRFWKDCGLVELDGDGDGVPCNALCRR